MTLSPSTPEERSPRKLVVTAGLAMFSMFFGSGNLVFPILIGIQTNESSPLALLGFILTAVLVPFLGLLGIILFKGNREAFFAPLGKTSTFLLILFMLMILGPFGVVPRCITVAFGGVQLLYPHFSFPLFSGIFCTLVLLLIWRENKIVDIIGRFLTPFKLGGLVLLVLAGLWAHGPVPEPAASLSTSQAFATGLFKGYQTMDLIAAFFFAATIFHYLETNLPKSKNNHVYSSLFKHSLGASLIGAFLLLILYAGLVILGAKYAPVLTSVSPEALLAAISGETLGRLAIPMVSLTLGVSCLATASILSSLFVSFLEHDVSQKLLKREIALGVTILTTFALSLLGFASICKGLGAILDLAYPALIVLTVLNILEKIFPYSFLQEKALKRVGFWGVLIVMGGFRLFALW